MRKYLLAATAAAAVAASPASARDNAWYAGIEGGVMVSKDLALDYDNGLREVDNAYKFDFDMGIDADLIGGYDMGPIRAEAEVGYKHASLNETIADISLQLPGDPPTYPTDGNIRIISSMLNLLADFGEDDGWGGYAGLGVGLARTDIDVDSDALGIGFEDQDDTSAWQIIAGIRRAISPTMDLGLKYRFFNTGKLSFSNDSNVAPFNADARFKSHSLLASLIFNFAPPPPVVIAPPPPPPPPPATQTCPDGSVILATDVCPAPPPPPPPPPPAGERG